MGRLTGEYRVHDEQKSGGRIFAAGTASDLVIVNSFFQKKDHRLITYRRRHYSIQIDYFLLRSYKINMVKDCKDWYTPWEPIVIQHRLTKILLKTATKKQRPPPKIRWHLLEKKGHAREFQKRVVDKMIETNGR